MTHVIFNDRNTSAWIRRHVCRSAQTFVKGVAGAGGGTALPHLVADAFVRSITDEMGFPSALSSGCGEDAGAPAFRADETMPVLRIAGERCGRGSPRFDYALTLHGVPVWGAGVEVTLVGKVPTLVDASVRLPLMLPQGPMPAPDGVFLPRMIDGVTVSQVFMLERPADIVSKRLVLHRTEPHRIGATGRVMMARDIPLFSRRPLPRRARTGAFCFTSELVFDIRCRDDRIDRWRVLLDATSGAMVHAERLSRDIMSDAVVARSSTAQSADRVPSPFAAEVAERGGPRAVAGDGGWPAILKASALHAAHSVPNIKWPGQMG